VNARDRGYRKLLTVAQVPVFVHWSVPAVAMVFCGITFPDLKRALWLCAGCLVVLVLHEAAHALVARWLGVKVFAVHISAAGGLCRMQRPPKVSDGMLIFGAGIAAQAMLFGLTLTVAMAWGWPRSVAGTSLLLCFTIVNVILLVSSLLPYTSRTGLLSDGG
jgi:hypothetical protein